MKKKDSSKSLFSKKWILPHMQRTFKIISRNLSFCDAVLEIVDARIPFSSRSQEIYFFTKSKTKFIFLNKSDLAERNETEKWINYFKRNKGIQWAEATNLKSLNPKQLLNRLEAIFHTQMKHKKWYGKRPLRILIIGMPNVGKSTFINKLTNQKKTLVGNVPGVTKGEQIIKVNDDLVFIDTPGVLGELTEKQSFFLMVLGSIKESNYDKQTLAENLVEYLIRFKKDYLKRFFNFENSFFFENQGWQNQDWLLEYAKKRNFLKKKNWDLERAAEEFLHRFRNNNGFPLSLETISDKGIFPS